MARTDRETSVTPYLQALDLILQNVAPLPPERLPLELALGRVAAHDVDARITLPAADNSQMDGYAVRSTDLSAASAERPVVLKVAQRITAGDAPQASLIAGQAARIMTGAPIPPGADAVVKQEDVERTGDEVRIAEGVEPGKYLRRAGEDIRAGDRAVEAGTELGASELALLAALGETHVHVHRRPRVAVLSTGDEIAEIGQAAPGKLVDSNSLALALRLRALGCEVVQLGVASDDPAAIRARFEAARGCDAVLSSAGVSVGEKDFVKGVLEGLGAKIRLERLAIRPGKPLVFATTADQLYFGLPGNPVSSRVTFEIFVRPALRKLLGHRRAERTLPAQLGQRISKVEALTFFTRVRLRREADRLVAEPMPKQNSNYLTSLVGAEGLAILPAGQSELPEGARVEVVLL